MSKMISPLQQVRSEYTPKLPPALRSGASVKVEKGAPLAAFADAEKIAALFPSTSNMPDLKFSAGDAGESKPVNVAVILSGGQAPGGHNVIAGIYEDRKSTRLNSSHGY